MAILSAVDLHKSFGGVKAVDGVTLEVKEGERLAVVGPNGSGKTTLINLLSGLYPPDRGRVFLQTLDVTKTPIHVRVKLGIARSFQLPQLFPELTVYENVAIAVAALRGFSLKAVPQEEVRSILELFELWDRRSVKASSLSEGEKKILDVALAYVSRPKVLLLDEPTSSVAEEDKIPLMERLLERLRGISIVMVEHDLDVVERFAERVVAMRAGKVVTVARPSDVKTLEI
jgi:branched-chain amino acid transport system ATP-binding protein